MSELTSFPHRTPSYGECGQVPAGNINDSYDRFYSELTFYLRINLVAELNKQLVDGNRVGANFISFF